MAENALELITRAYYLSQVVAKGFETVSGSQIYDGLFLLNALLDVKGTDLRLIPYYTETTFDTEAGVDFYQRDNLLSVETLTFNIGNVRYEMIPKGRDEFFGTGRIDGVQSLPFTYHLERNVTGSKIYLYYVPQDVYVMKAWGKVGLTNVTLDTDMSTIYSSSYREYLRFAVAEYICLENSQTFPPDAKKKFEEIRKKAMDTSPPDLHLKKRSVLGKQDCFNWAYANIPGYSP